MQFCMHFLLAYSRYAYMSYGTDIQDAIKSRDFVAALHATDFTSVGSELFFSYSVLVSRLLTLIAW